MFRKLLILMAIVLVFSRCEVQGEVVDVNWVTCTDGFWSDINNWNPAVIPDNNVTDSYRVTIDTRACGNEVEVRVRQNRTIDDLTIYGDVDLESYVRENITDIVLAIVEDLDVTLTLENVLTNYGQLEVSALIIDGNLSNREDMQLGQSVWGSVQVVGNVTNAADAVLALDYCTIFGNLQNQERAILDIDYEVDIEDGNLENAGLIQIAPTGEIYVNQYFHNVNDILIYGGECGVDEGILDNNSTGVIRGFGVLYAEQLLRNKGQIIAFGGSLALLAEGPLLSSGLLSNYPLSSLQIKPAEDVNNQGTIEVHAGGGVAFDCNLVNEPNGTINLNGGTLAATTIVQKAGATFEGFGGITGNLTIEPNTPTEPNSIIEFTGPTNVVGNVTIDPNGRLKISDGTTLITGHTACNNGTIHMIGGRIICQGGLTNNSCNIIWEPGTDTNEADFNLDGIVNLKDLAYLTDTCTWLWRASWH